MNDTISPAPYPDVIVYRPLPLNSWTVTVRRNGLPMDLTTKTLTAPVSDDGVYLGDLTIDLTNGLIGKARFQLELATYNKLRRYATWFFQEDVEFAVPLVWGRIVKAY